MESVSTTCPAEHAAADIASIAPPPGLEMFGPAPTNNSQKPSLATSLEQYPKPHGSSTRDQLRSNGQTVLMSVQLQNRERREEGDETQHCRSRKRGGRHTSGTQSTDRTGSNSHQSAKPAGGTNVVAAERHAALLRVLDSRKAGKDDAASQSGGKSSTSASIPSLWRSARISVNDALDGAVVKQSPFDVRISETKGFVRRPPGIFGQDDLPTCGNWSAAANMEPSSRFASQQVSRTAVSNQPEPIKIRVSELFGEVMSL